MFIKNITQGSVLLPNGRELTTWLEVSKEEAEAFKQYNNVLFTFSTTQPKDNEKSASPFDIQEASTVGSTSLSDLKAPEAPVAPPVVETPEAPVVAPTTNKKSKA